LLLCRSLGDPQFKKGDGEPTVECMPDMRRIELQPGDTALVLASDGLWDKVSDATAVSVIDKVGWRSTVMTDGFAAIRYLYM
jgi:serine/threonine protein phosphatase PrpC